MFKKFLNYTFLVSEAKYKAKYGSGLIILTPKQMLQRLPKALAQVKAGNTLKTYQIKSDKLYTFCIEQNKLLKKYIII